MAGDETQDRYNPTAIDNSDGNIASTVSRPLVVTVLKADDVIFRSAFETMNPDPCPIEQSTAEVGKAHIANCDNAWGPRLPGQ